MSWLLNYPKGKERIRKIKDCEENARTELVTWADRDKNYGTRISARLFQLFGPKNHVLTKASLKVCLVSIKRNFLEKVAFYNCEENAQVHFGALEVHFCQKSVGVLIYPLGWVEQLPNCPSIKNLQSLTQCLIPFISSLCFTQSQLPHASHLFSQLCSLRAATSLSLCVSLSFLLSSVENLLPLLLLSSSSSTIIPL